MYSINLVEKIKSSKFESVFYINYLWGTRPAAITAHVETWPHVDETKRFVFGF